MAEFEIESTEGMHWVKVTSNDDPIRADTFVLQLLAFRPEMRSRVSRDGSAADFDHALLAIRHEKPESGTGLGLDGVNVSEPYGMFVILTTTAVNCSFTGCGYQFPGIELLPGVKWCVSIESQVMC